VPQEWKSFKFAYKYKTSLYHIEVFQLNGAGALTVKVDEVEQKDKTVLLVDDGLEHFVVVQSFENFLK
jgi:cellobiose phosphorylase